MTCPNYRDTMADFFGDSRRVNGNFVRSAPAEALKKRFLSSDGRCQINISDRELRRPSR